MKKNGDMQKGSVLLGNFNYCKVLDASRDKVEIACAHCGNSLTCFSRDGTTTNLTKHLCNVHGIEVKDKSVGPEEHCLCWFLVSTGVLPSTMLYYIVSSTIRRLLGYYLLQENNLQHLVYK